MKCSGENVIQRGIFHVLYHAFHYISIYHVISRKFGLLFEQCIVRLKPLFSLVSQINRFLKIQLLLYNILFNVKGRIDHGAKESILYPPVKETTGYPVSKEASGYPVAKEASDYSTAKEVSGYANVKELSGYPVAKDVAGYPELAAEAVRFGGGRSSRADASLKHSTDGGKNIDDRLPFLHFIALEGRTFFFPKHAYCLVRIF